MRWRRWFGGDLLTPDEREEDLAREIRTHLDLEAEEQRGTGLSDAEAERAARRAFGNRTLVREDVRRVWGLATLDALAQDLRYALRSATAAPAFTLVVVATLAIGVGAIATVFTLLNALVLRELPVERPDRLVGIDAADPDGTSRGMSRAAFREIARAQRSFSEVIGWDGNGLVSVESGGVALANFWAVSGNFHAALGQVPQLGRLLTPGDEERGDPVVVIGDGFWHRQLGLDPAVIGREIQIEGEPFTIVGVTRPGFTGLWVGQAPDVTVTLASAVGIRRARGFPPVDERSSRIEITARLRDRAMLEEARAEMEAMWPGLRAATVPPSYNAARREAFLAARPVVESMATGREAFLRPRFTRPLVLLMGVAGLMLLNTCVHLASLLLARAARRGGELSLRVALGASRGRLIRQVLTEGLPLSLAGAALGLVFALWSSRWLAGFMTQQFLTPAALNLHPDAWIIAAAVTAALVAGALFGVAPASFAARRDPAAALHRHARGLPSLPGGNALIVAQVALTTVLFVAAGLLARSVTQAHRSDPGFDADGLLQLQLMMRPGAPRDDVPAVYHRQVVERVGVVPGVQAAGLASNRTGWASAVRQMVTTSDSTADAEVSSRVVAISPGYFGTAGVRLVHGRDLRWDDGDEGVPAAVVSRALARRLFANGDALGQTMRHGPPPGVERRIVGVVEDARLDDVREEPGFMMYVPLSYHEQGRFLHVKTAADSGAFRAALAREVDALGRQYVNKAQTTHEAIDIKLIDLRLTGVVSQFLAALSLALACIGVYGVMAYRAAARTREIGIRVALGADRRMLLWQHLRSAWLLVAAGCAIGVPLALAATRVLGSLLFGVETSDPLTHASAVAALVAAGTVGAWLPARRAAQVDPAVALRAD